MKKLIFLLLLIPSLCYPKINKNIVNTQASDSVKQNKILVGIDIEFEQINDRKFPNFIGVKNNSLTNKYVLCDTTKKLSFSSELVDSNLKYEEITIDKNTRYVDAPLVIKSSQFSEVAVTNKIIQKLDVKKDLGIDYFKILKGNNKYIWIVSPQKIIRFDGNYYHVFDIKNIFDFDNLYCGTAILDDDGSIWVGAKNQIFKFDGSIITCIKKIFDPSLEKKILYPNQQNSFGVIRKIISFKSDIYFSCMSENYLPKFFKISNNKLCKINVDSYGLNKFNTRLHDINLNGDLIIISNIWDLEKTEELKKRTKTGDLLEVQQKSQIWQLSGNKVSKFIIKKEKKIFNIYIDDIHFDNKKNLWISSDSGVLRINDQVINYYNTKKTDLNSWMIYDFIENYNHKCILRTENGIYIYDDVSDRFNIDLDFNNLKFSEGIRFINYSEKNIWYVNEGNIHKLKNVNIEKIKIHENDIFPSNWQTWCTSFFYQNKKEILTLTNTRGLVKISNDSLFYVENLKNELLDTFEQFIEYSQLFQDDKKNTLITYTSSSTTTKNVKYLNMVKIDSVFKKYLKVRFKPNIENNGNDRILCSFKDSFNNIWIGSIYGLYKYSNEKLTFYSSKNNFNEKFITNIYEDKLKNIWLIHDKSLSKINNNQITFIGPKNGLKTKKINSFTEFGIENYWISTSNGLFSYDGVKISKFSAKNGLKDNLNRDFVKCIFKDNNGRIIICFPNSLKELKFTDYNVTTKHIFNVDLWFENYFLTEKNIVIIQEGETSFINYDLNELEEMNKPLVSNLNKIYINDENIDFQKIKMKRESDSISYFNNNLNLSKINFSDINSYYNFPINLKLPFNYNNITFLFDAIKWENQSNLNFAYKIDNLDEEWIISNNPKAEYRNLLPGKHVLSFKVKSSFSEWSVPITYEFTILPPWWNTWYARLGYLILGTLLIWRIIKFRTNSLEKRQIELESQIEKATGEIKSAYITLEKQHKEIKDSIKYAKRIQNAILPNVEIMKSIFKDCYVLYMPKDIVAGDFFWMEKVGESIYFAAADCTGHGVPGAMISVICSNALSKALLEDGLRNTGKILDKTRDIVVQNLAKSGEDVYDGMDVSLCCLNLKTSVLYSSGANNPVLILKKGSSEFDVIKADRQPIGLFSHAKPFKEHQTQLEKGDKIYIFTDGYQDQFGGIKGKKLMSKKFKKLILESNQLSMSQQKDTLENQFNDWRGELEQIDDVCVIGVEI